MKRIRSLSVSYLVDKTARGLARLGRLDPRTDPANHGVEVLRDIAYAPTGREAHLLDVYRPRDLGDGGHPVVVYVHGGGFQLLSKETHWLMALAFARRGYVVFNINYRLAPAHPYPAAVEDACAALLWVHRNAARFGGDPQRIALAGESAGANLVTALTVAATWPRDETFARELHDANIPIRAVIPACGILQVTDSGRFLRRKKHMPAYIADRIEEVAAGYIGRRRSGVDLADPLVVLEQSAPAERQLPAFYTFVGTRDPILDDTRRLHQALIRLGATCEIRYFPGEVHAFHALLWRPIAIDCWRDSLAWLRTKMC